VLPTATADTHELIRQAIPLVEQLYQPGLKYLKAGIMLGGIVPDNSLQGNLFADNSMGNQRLLMSTIDNINFSQRDDVIKYVAAGLKRNWKMRQELRSKRYTTRWDELYEIK
jgi:DNA polymerase V